MHLVNCRVDLNLVDSISVVPSEVQGVIKVYISGWSVKQVLSLGKGS